MTLLQRLNGDPTLEVLGLVSDKRGLMWIMTITQVDLKQTRREQKVQIDLFDASKESTDGQHPWLYGTLVLCTVWGEAGYFEIGETLAVCRRERNDGLHDRGVAVRVGRPGHVHA